MPLTSSRFPIDQPLIARRPSGRTTFVAVRALVLGCVLLATVGGTGCDRTTIPPPGAAPATGSPETLATDWPSLLGPNRDGTTTGPLRWAPLPWSECWRAACGTGYGSPVIADGRVVVRGREGEVEILLAFALESGRELWRREWPATFECDYDYSDGPSSTPTVADGRVHSISADGLLSTCDARTGSLLWERSLTAEYQAPLGGWGFGSSPVLVPGSGDRHQELLLAVGGGSCGATVVAFDPASGSELWRAGDEDGSYSTPFVFRHGNDAGVERTWGAVLTDRSLMLVDLERRIVSDSVPFRSNLSLQVNATTPVRVGDLLIVSAYGLGSAGYAIDDSGRLVERWRERGGLDSQYALLIPDGDGVIGFASRVREIRRIGADDGRLDWKLRPSIGRGCAIKVGERLIQLGETGEVSVHEPSGATSGFRELGSPLATGLKDRCFSTPAYAQGLLVVRGEGGLIAFRAAD